jgi:hypothetical protein
MITKMLGSPQYHRPRFGLVQTPGTYSFLQQMAANVASPVPNMASVAMNKWIYSAVILSRIILGRDLPERVECTVRDGTGWYVWFNGMTLFQAGLLSMVFNKKIKGFVLQNLKPADNPAQHIANTLIFSHNKLLKVSDASLKQRAEQYLKKFASTETATELAEGIKKHFNQMRTLRAVVNAVSLVASIALLGVGMNFITDGLIEVILRRKHGKPKLTPDAQKSASSPDVPLPKTESRPYADSPFALPVLPQQPMAFSPVPPSWNRSGFASPWGYVPQPRSF